MDCILFMAWLLYFCTCICIVDCLDSDGIKLPTRCETCKFVATELQEKFRQIMKKKDVLDISGHIERSKKIAYSESELGFVEALESVCENILSYNMHKEHKDSNRFAKGQSQTMRTLHNLKDKGVKVDLGIPEHLWDEPSAEVTRMKSECEQLIEEYEDDLEEWYLNSDLRKTRLQSYLCRQRFLRGHDSTCLTEGLKGDKIEL